jgi:hypothetical protein
MTARVTWRDDRLAGARCPMHATREMEHLLDTPHVRVTRDGTLVRIDRSSVPYASIEQFDAMTDAMVVAMQGIARKKHVLLLDIRVAPIRAGDDFDAAAMRFNRAIFRGFARVAVLIATKVGKLQLARFDREHENAPRSFEDEAAALAHLGG